jgi:hypothetical protein
MSSPGARQRRRREQYQNPRTRSELVTAVGAGVAIVAGTALMIWLLRPGGLADRQPRASWLVALALIAALSVVYTVLRRDKRRETSRPVVLAIALGAVAVIAIVAGIVWPGGLLRHTPKAITVPTPTSPTASTPTQTTPTPTTLGGASTSTPGATPTTKAATATTAPPAATTAPGNTAGSTATTKPVTSPTATAPPVSPSQ